MSKDAGPSVLTVTSVTIMSAGVEGKFAPPIVVEAVDAEGRRFRKVMSLDDGWVAQPDCKDRGGPVGTIGECLSCDAECGVACRRK